MVNSSLPRVSRPFIIPHENASKARAKDWFENSHTAKRSSCMCSYAIVVLHSALRRMPCEVTPSPPGSSKNIPGDEPSAHIPR